MKTAILLVLGALACGSVDDSHLFDDEARDEGDDVDVEAVIDEQGQDMFFLDNGDEPEVDDEGDIGTLEQGLSAPSLYGQNVSTSNRCVPGPGVTCAYPDDKIARYRFRASTCNSWWQTRVVESFAQFVSDVENFGGWDIKDPTAAGLADVYLDCGDAGGTAFGAAVCSLGSTKAHPAGGNYRKYSECVIKIDTAELESHGVWAGKSDAQRKKLARNVIMHEYLHTAGLGHHARDATNSAIMMAPMDLATTIQWDSLRLASATELGWMSSYVP